MIQASRSRSLRFLFFSASIFLRFLPGFAEDAEPKPNVTSSSNTGSKIVLIILGIVALGLFLFFLFKLWQKKKRDEQYARLLKLFEEDDELEVELGLRD